VPSVVTLLAEDTDEGERLDVWLARRLPEQSRARLQALIADGAVRTDGSETHRASARVRAGQHIEVRVPDPIAPQLDPEDLPLTIVYQDAHLLVLDKPAGLVVHPGAGVTGGTLVNALLHHVRDLSGVGGVLRPGIVHRLDKGTSGLLVVAKNDQAHRQLARQFAGRTVEKEYLAVVHGLPQPPHCVVDAAIGRDPRQRQRMHVCRSGGRAALSVYDVQECLDGTALVRVRIHTGRTHQVRVHMASCGHPLVGDAAYGGKRTAACRNLEARQAVAAFARPALHAARLAFTHPTTGERLTFTSPLPQDLQQLLLDLRPKTDGTPSPVFR
jgi:23S rRNA pseudouridine1911/1915/1917 synthase